MPSESEYGNRWVIMLAAEHGVNPGASLQVPFVEIRGKAILQICIERFLTAVPGIRVLTLLPESCVREWEDYCLKKNFLCPQIVATSGFTRYHSVRQALQRIGKDDLVAIHEASRPVVDVSLVRRLFDEAALSGAAVPVHSSPDAALGSSGDDLGRVRLRKYPQVFSWSVLHEAYSQPFDTGFTDDASVVLKTGKVPAFIEGGNLDFKIRTREDLRAAALLIGR